MADENGTVQGHEGYVNPIVQPGDGLVYVDGHDVERMQSRQLRSLLLGCTGTTVVMDFARASSSTRKAAGEIYRVYARRNELNCLQSWTKLSLPPNPSAPAQKEVTDPALLFVSPPPAQRPPIPPRSGGSLNARNVSPPPAAPGYAAQQAGIGLVFFIGKESKKPVVTDVTDLVDQNGVSQGRPGYENAAVSPGDTLLSVDHREVLGCSVDEVEALVSPIMLPTLGHMFPPRTSWDSPPRA